VTFTPAGYLYKRVAARPEWLQAPHVVDLHSLSTCSSKAYADDYFEAWKHNDYWLFDDPDTMRGLADAAAVDLSVCRLFYYELSDEQLDETSRTWSALRPALPAPLAVRAPEPGTIHLEGYDVVCFSVGNQPECSPLSCNSLAADLAVNEHCLFATAEEAKAHLDGGRFEHCEPGPFRIVAVYSVR
jgi:hypothetical protein